MEILTITEGTDRKALEKATDVLMRGGIVLYPTDTLYGLAVDATNPKALARLRALKGRETKKPISMVVATVEAMSDHIEWNDTARKLAHSHLPGPLTLVLPARPHVLPDLQLLGMVGIRVPEDEFALALSETFGRPYTATSANRSGQVTQTTTKEILRQFGSLIHEIDLVIDAGERSGGKASTVVTFKGTTPYILREGVLSKEDLGL